jgi:hypothetical protein
LRRWLLATAPLTGSLLFASCGAAPSSQLVPRTLGPPGHSLTIDVERGARVTSVHPGVGPDPVGPGAQYTYRVALPAHGSVQVNVDVAYTPPTSAHARWITNDDFNNIPEHKSLWEGLPADIGVEPCSTPAGPCRGYLGGVVILDHQTLYNVFGSSLDRTTLFDVVHSVRLVGPRRSGPA